MNTKVLLSSLLAICFFSIQLKASEASALVTLRSKRSKSVLGKRKKLLRSESSFSSAGDTVEVISDDQLKRTRLGKGLIPRQYYEDVIPIDEPPQFPLVLFSHGYKKKNVPNPEQWLIHFINNENNQIDMAMYRFSLYKVSEELVKKKNQGVKVRLFVDPSVLGDHPKPLQFLLDNNVDVRKVLGAKKGYPGIMHHKFVVFNNNNLANGNGVVWAGSFNGTGAAVHKNWEDAIVLDNQRVVQEYALRVQELQKSSMPMTQENVAGMTKKSTRSRIRSGIPITPQRLRKRGQ